jgi:hypothetical protein
VDVPREARALLKERLMPRPLAVAPAVIPATGPGRPRGHARPVLEWAFTDRMMPERLGSTAVDGVIQPERRLMIAVLDEAVGSFIKLLGNDTRRTRDLIELERWFTDGDRAWPFSFLRICEALDLSPERVREALARWCVRQGDFFARRTAAKLSREKRRRAVRPAPPSPTAAPGRRGAG